MKISKQTFETRFGDIEQIVAEHQGSAEIEIEKGALSLFAEIDADYLVVDGVWSSYDVQPCDEIIIRVQEVAVRIYDWDTGNEKQILVQL